jgi:inorganic pyrophosphatase
MSFLSSGPNPPEEINVFIEVSAGGLPVKYEYDKKTKLLFVDRFLYTGMIYPCNYGFVPNTLGGDGDPLDVLVFSTYAILPGAVVVARPIGVLLTEDEKGQDAKLITVPTVKIDPFLSKVEDIDDLPEMFKQQIDHFFEQYKKLEHEKWVKIVGWEQAEYAQQLILEGIAKHEEEKHSE